MRISDWSSDVCSSDLRHRTPARTLRQRPLFGRAPPRDALRVFAMKPITEILATMEYGPSPESATEAQAWLDRHQRRFGLFIDNQWSAPGEPVEIGCASVRERGGQ